ncbi:hypothetical protein BCV69DRAFT_3341 [Microstroma glucosiphilum]|uniref:GATA-type domain-containing protein n=1 Tax=Pseudomicrostroma glucosiphilum TaxID=1684307 RepID=A0A316UEC7_9BASI|nr:hypothetical protein BCV69DRAFT_3341 [Pseudomicrostroma glucosiphilum]PWN23569.1 hypothetical protein BCV69DRAFT_3341 [Pseudomicrostroma glucosiphilum]
MATLLSSSSGRCGEQSDSLKLPAIRSLADVRRPCPSPSSSSATDPPRRPLPWPLHEETGSKLNPPSLSSSGRFTSATSSSSSSSAPSAQSSTQLSRPLLQRPLSTPGTAPTSAPQPHPFFDRGKKSSLYVPPSPEPSMQPLDDVEVSAAREQADDSLSDTEEALRLALDIVAQSREPGNSLTQKAAEEACRETSRALFLLQAWSAQNRIRSRALLRSRGQHSAPGDDRSSADATPSGHGLANSSAIGADSLRRHTTATLDPAGPRRSSPAGWTPHAAITEVRRPLREVRTVYEGFDPETDDLQPRPPMTVIRTHSGCMAGSTSGHSHTAPQPHGAEAEASYMYAPPSIRNRLADLHKEQQRVLPPIMPSQPVQQLHSHDWDRSAHRHGPMPVPISHSEPRWGPVPASSPAQRWPPGLSELSPAARNTAPTVSPDRQHGQWSDGHSAVDNYSVDNEGGVSKYKKRSRAPAPSACRSCGTSETPEWRRGPDGARTLCNACGLHFAKVAKRKSSTEDEPLDDAATAAAGRLPPLLHQSSGSS